MECLDTNWIGGRWVPATSARRLRLVNPSTARPAATLVLASPADVDQAVQDARRALTSWRGTLLSARAACLDRLRNLLGENTERFAHLLADEIGCPLWFGREMQVPMPIRNLGAMLDALHVMELEQQAGTSAILREPVGVVGAITPWNAPLHQIVAKIGAAVAAGCTVVLKPSELAPATTRALIGLMDGAGFPPGVVNVVFGDAEAGTALVCHPDVDMVSFTGSVGIGRAIGAAAGQAIKKVALELGGKSAAILLPNAPLDQAVAGVLRTCFANSGQVCVAQTRLLAPWELQDEVEALCRQHAASWHVGLPSDSSARMGPMATAAGRDRFLRTVAGAVADGARVVTGGTECPDGLDQGFFVRPTVLSEVTPAMDVVREEVFAPLLTIQTYRDVDEAVEIANATRFGLSGAVWNADVGQALAVARRLRTGQVSLNGAPQNYATPFGGCGWSGTGRENGRFGIDEFLQFKAVHGAWPNAA